MKCVAYYLCSESGSVVKDGAYLIDERFDSGDGEEVEAPACPALEFCCDKDDFRGTVPPLNKCATYKKPVKCGFRNEKGLGNPVKSVQGTVDYAQYAEFPWVLAIQNLTVSNKSFFLGGGSLIHPKVVLTAAHIVADSRKSSLSVRGGEHNARSNQEICPQIDRKVNDVIMHESFDRPTQQYNVALLVLAQAFEMTASINTVCLPRANQKFNGQTCFSSGWGKKNFLAVERHQAFPKIVRLPVVSAAECQTMLRETRLGEDFILNESFLCAGRVKRALVELILYFL